MNTIDDDMNANQVWLRAWCADMRERAARAVEAAAVTHPAEAAVLLEVASATRELELPGSEP